MTIAKHCGRIVALATTGLLLAAVLAPGLALGDGSGSVPVYRLFNRWTTEHLFTTSSREYYDLACDGWTQEGIAWYAPTADESDTPVYRLRNPYTGDHYYTDSAYEYETLGEAGWDQEQEVFRSDDGKGTPIYQLFNPYVKGAGSHHFTTDKGEYEASARAGWTKENVAFYAEKGGDLINNPVQNPKDGEVALYAKQFVGCTYVWGGATPEGFDCSGLVMYVYRHFGISLPHNSNEQIAFIKDKGLLKTSIDELRPGAIIGPSQGGHVGIYFGKIDGVPYLVDAVDPSHGVCFRPINFLDDLVGGNLF